MKKTLFFSSFIRSLMKGYITTLVSSFIAIKYVRLFGLIIQNSLDESLIPSLIIGLCLSLPIILQLLIIDNRRILKTQNFKDKYEPLYTRCQIEYISSILYIGVYFIRRLLFVAAIVLLEDYYSLSLLIITLTNFGTLVYLAAFRPFIEKSDLFAEIANELLVYAIGICFISMGFYHENPQT